MYLWANTAGSPSFHQINGMASNCCWNQAPIPAVKPFKEALVNDGIPYASFEVDDIEAECRRLKSLDVNITQEPVNVGDVTVAMLDDTCGNLIQLIQRT